MDRLTVAEVEEVAHRLAREALAWDEPIPEFKTRRPGILEGSIAVPFQTFDGKLLYRGTIPKLAILFYVMIKDHPFQNGNKRIAMTTLFYLLFRDRKWLRVSDEKLYRFAQSVAGSDVQLKEEEVARIEQFLRRNIISLARGPKR